MRPRIAFGLRLWAWGCGGGCWNGNKIASGSGSKNGAQNARNGRRHHVLSLRDRARDTRAGTTAGRGACIVAGIEPGSGAAPFRAREKPRFEIKVSQRQNPILEETQYPYRPEPGPITAQRHCVPLGQSWVRHRDNGGGHFRETPTSKRYSLRFFPSHSPAKDQSVPSKNPVAAMRVPRVACAFPFGLVQVNPGKSGIIAPPPGRSFLQSAAPVLCAKIRGRQRESCAALPSKPPIIRARTPGG